MKYTNQEILNKVMPLIKETNNIAYRELSELTDYPMSTIRAALKKAGVEKKSAPRGSQIREGELGERGKRSVALKHENPLRTLKSIADEVGVTRQRVDQILKKMKLNEQYPASTIAAKRGNKYEYCIECGKNLYGPESHRVSNPTDARKRGMCSSCFNIAKENKKQALRTTVNCPTCDKEIIIRKKELKIRNRHVQNYVSVETNRPNVPFCSRKCINAYYTPGIKYGFGAHPENSRKSPTYLKHLKYTESKIKPTPSNI